MNTDFKDGLVERLLHPFFMFKIDLYYINIININII